VPLAYPLTAYRRDRRRAPVGQPFGPHDAAWVLIASFFDNLGVLEPEARAEALARHEAALAAGFGAEPRPLAPEDPQAWIARLRMALTVDAPGANHPEVTLAVRGMADAMADAGAIELADVALRAVRRAFPKVCPRTSVGVLLHRARLLAAAGRFDDAMDLISAADEEARAATLLDLIQDVERERACLEHHWSAAARTGVARVGAQRAR
jgi:hypothetical protein